MKRIYSTDLSDVEWECLEFHFPASNKRGRPKTHTAREILNAVFYVLRSGCPWRLLPYDFPPWETVYWWFRRWRTDGTWERLNTALRERLRRRGWGGIRSLAREWWTPSRLGPPQLAAKREDTTAEKRCAAESAIS